ncbi:hypothetical protein ACFV4M_17470, partial [Kitasatospora indigofera]|uniref:hypothetical protein n=1 Tax=Kitasatospora indigofera TaxID=67307 RepID=UPI0036699639
MKLISNAAIQSFLRIDGQCWCAVSGITTTTGAGRWSAVGRTTASRQPPTAGRRGATRERERPAAWRAAGRPRRRARGG